MTINTKQALLLGALVRINVPMNCELSISVLKSRLENIGLGSYAPSPRSRADALRLAFGRVMKESVRQVDHGGTTELVVVEIPRDKKAENSEPQKWAIHRRERNAEYQEVAYTLVGHASLSLEGAISIPGGLESEVVELTDHLMVTAEQSKLRYCINDVLSSVSKPIAIGWGHFIPNNRKEFLEAHVAPCFDNLDNGSLTISLLEIANTPKNVEVIKEEVQTTISDQINGIMIAVLEAQKQVSGLTKGVIKEWTCTLENLKANMELMGALSINVPTNIEDLELKIAAVKAEYEAERKKGPRRIIQVSSPCGVA